MARKLSEIAVGLITDYVRNNIEAALITIQADRADNQVTLEAPPSQSYFNYPQAHGYRCPAIFVIDGGMNFRLAEMKANHINAMLKVYVTVKVEADSAQSLTLKSWRYQAALHQVLNAIDLVSSDNKAKLNCTVSAIHPSAMYTQADAQPDEQAQFFKEYKLDCDVNYYEGF